jgi:hypothetical protein
MKYQAGDPVWATVSRPDLKITGRLAATVIGPAPKEFDDQDYIIDVHDAPCPVFGFPVPHGLWLAPEPALTPRRDDYDGFKLGDWELCPWQHKRDFVRPVPADAQS